jgi:hypothetical protein
VALSHSASRPRAVLTVKSQTRIFRAKLPNPLGWLKPLLIKKLSPSGSTRKLDLIPIGSLRVTAVQAVTPPTLVLARFQVQAHMSYGLVQPDKCFFSFPCLLPVPPSLSRGKLGACCVVRLTELGLSIVQDLADALCTCSGDW